MKILLYRGRGFLPWLIRFQTRSPYHHAAIVLHGSTVFESNWKWGVKACFLQRTPANNTVDVYEVATTPEQDGSIRRWLVSQSGKPYDLTMVIRFVTRKQATRKTKGKWFCSELVYAAFQAAGINLLERVEPWEVSPGLLARSPLLKFVGSQKLYYDAV